MAFMFSIFIKNILNISLIKYHQSLLNPNSLYETALQSTLCCDQSHFSRFECYPKKDKVKDILILFGYSAKLKKRRLHSYLLEMTTNQPKLSLKSHFDIQSHFFCKETLRNNLNGLLLHRPNSCEFDILTKTRKKEDKSFKKIVKQLTEEWRSNSTGLSEPHILKTTQAPQHAFVQ